VLERYVSIDNVCAWPNLTVLRDGTIIATIFNSPSHGRVEGDVECWASRDGKFWTKRGTPAEHEPKHTRMNVAAGLARNGDLIVLASGWRLQNPGEHVSALRPLPVWISRSSDGGRSWVVDKTSFPAALPNTWNFIPFGDIFAVPDGSLRTSAYSRRTGEGFCAFMLRSDDDGKTWTYMSDIAGRHNETAILPLGGGKWIAVARANVTGSPLNLFRSIDDGKNWRLDQSLTQAGELNGHLMRLADGRLLLAHGNRNAGQYGVGIKFSSDEGATWTEGAPLVSDLLAKDCGYPSTVQLPGGNLLTAFYGAKAPNHHRYHMGTVIWSVGIRGGL
jgi:hypothetical protein